MKATSVNKLLEKSFRLNWKRPALSNYKGETLLYSDLARSIAKMHIAYAHYGIHPGDKVVICSRNQTHWAVRFLGLPAVSVGAGVRAFRAAVATAIGFTVANIFCWLMNRLFVFKPGRYRWYVEFSLFFGVAALATVVALGVQSLLIKYAGLMTTMAVIVEVIVSFFFNFFIRKFIIFKG